MDSNNRLVRVCYRKMCIWGRKSPIEYTKPYEGGPTPILRSPQRKFYLVFTILNLVVFLALIIAYIVHFKLIKGDNVNECA